MARVTGADRCVQRLGRIGQAVRTRVGKGLRSAADLVAAEARTRLPKGSAADIAVVQRRDLAVEVVWAAPESAPLEFGTSQMAARPVMRPAAEAKRTEVVELVAQAVRRGVEEA